MLLAKVSYTIGCNGYWKDLGLLINGIWEEGRRNKGLLHNRKPQWGPSPRFLNKRSFMADMTVCVRWHIEQVAWRYKKILPLTGWSLYARVKVLKIHSRSNPQTECKHLYCIFYVDKIYTKIYKDNYPMLVVSTLSKKIAWTLVTFLKLPTLKTIFRLKIELKTLSALILFHFLTILLYISSLYYTYWNLKYNRTYENKGFKNAIP